MNKEELYKLALSGPTYKSYQESIGFDDCQKFLDAFNIKLNSGKNVPVHLVYLYYYNWAKESDVKPERYTVFVFTWGRHIQSKAWSYAKKGKHYRVYKLEGFPSYTPEDVQKARNLVSDQKARQKKKKQSKRKIKE